MIDPNASRRPGKMNIAKMLDYVRANPMAMADGSLKRTMRGGMSQPGMPPLQPMMMARSGGAPEPMGAVGPTHGGTSYGGGLSAPAPAAPAAPSVSNNANAPSFGFDHFGSNAFDDAFGAFGGATNAAGLTPAAIQAAYAASVAPTAPAVAVGKRGIDDARGIARSMGIGVNAAGQPMGMATGGMDYGGFNNSGYGHHDFGVNPQTAAHEAAMSSPTRGEYGSASGAGAAGPDTGTGKIVCTAMNQDYGFGSFRQAIWLRHSAGLHPAYERGYHAMFRPLLAYGRKRSTLAQRVVMAALEDIARMRTFDIRREARAGFWRGLNRGRLYRVVLEPLCFVVGLMGVRRG